MAPTSKTHPSGCPVAFALDAIGDRWSLLIVRDLMLRGAHTYGAFLDGGEGIATNVLADRLKALEAAGIITKTTDPKNRRRNLYILTDKGLDLAPVMVEMIRWSAKYDSRPEARKGIAERIAKDPAGVLADIRAGTPVGHA